LISSRADDHATIVKLMRVACLVPVLVIISAMKPPDFSADKAKQHRFYMESLIAPAIFRGRIRRNGVHLHALIITS
jgi:uncharacterized membrane protein YadS